MTMKSRSRHIPDFAATVLFRNSTAGAVSATTASAGLALNKLVDAYWDNGELPHDDVIGASIHVVSLDATTGDETYTFTLEVAADAAFSVPVTVATLPAVTAVGHYDLVVDTDTVAKQQPTATHMRVKAALAGTSPSINFSAFLVSKAI